jgi:hypothetical protein
LCWFRVQVITIGQSKLGPSKPRSSKAGHIRNWCDRSKRRPYGCRRHRASHLDIIIRVKLLIHASRPNQNLDRKTWTVKTSIADRQNPYH